MYNNRYRDAQGWIRVSSGFARKTPEGKSIVQRSLGEGLGLPGGPGDFVVFTDHVTGLQFIRSCRELHEKGLSVALGAYQRQVFLDFRFLTDDPQGRWSRLSGELGGRGVSDMDRGFREMDLRPILQPFRALMSMETCTKIAAVRSGTETVIRGSTATTRRGAAGAGARAKKALAAELMEGFDRLLSGVAQRVPGLVSEEAARTRFTVLATDLLGMATAPRGISAQALAPVWAYVILEPLGIAGAAAGHPAIPWLDEWMLAEAVRGCAAGMGLDPEIAFRAGPLIALLLENEGGAASKASIARLLRSPYAEAFLRVNTFEGVRWFHKESLALLLETLGAAPGPIMKAAEASGYKWDVFLETLSHAPAKAGGKSPGVPPEGPYAQTAGLTRKPRGPAAAAP